MSPVQQAKQATQAATTSDLDRLMARSVTYTPFAEQEPIDLSFAQVKRFISARTKSGQTASDEDIVKFMMLCKARGLNPWVGDAFLVGYDSQQGPTFSLITSIQALMKRAEAHPQFDGLQSGVIVQDVTGKIVEREGDLVLANEKLVGGWAKCYRKDRSVVCYDSLNLSTYDKGRSQWEKDKSGMIVKTAEASVLRKSFPSQLAGLYIQQEAALIQAAGEVAIGPVHRPQAKTLSDLAQTITRQPAVQEQPQPPIDDNHPQPTALAESGVPILTAADRLVNYRIAINHASTAAECDALIEAEVPHDESNPHEYTQEQQRHVVKLFNDRVALVSSK
jgi:phage recombination protein Bet